MAKKAASTSLAACFAKSGLLREQWHQRVVSFSMVENALMFYKDKHTLNTDSLELMLRMVKERMGVH